MIRLLKEVVFQLIAMLNVLEMLTKESGRYADYVTMALRDAKDQSGSGNLDLPDKVGELKALLQDHLDKLNSGQAIGLDLIDAMVTTLSQPFASGMLNSKTLGLLRKGLLLPSEMKAFQTAITEKERSCARCGRKLVSGEVIILVAPNGNNSDFEQWCTTCGTPYYVTCGHEHTVKVSDAFRRIIAKHAKECPQCASEVNEVVEEATIAAMTTTATPRSALDSIVYASERIESIPMPAQPQGYGRPSPMFTGDQWASLDAVGVPTMPASSPAPSRNTIVEQIRNRNRRTNS